MVYWVCSRCSKKYTLDEYEEDRFCRICGSLLQKTYDTDSIRNLNKISSNLGNNAYNEYNDILKEGIEKTYEIIERNISNITIDSLQVVKQVELYRQYWKPENINVILLAESHVYTNDRNYNIKCSPLILNKIINNYPLQFVRFVYCLGYGENELLNGVVTGRKNTGTPQFWKIFSASVAEDEANLEFQKILKKKTSFNNRLMNKVDILEKMKNKGIWLLDSSIIGLYGMEKKADIFKKEIINICWDTYLKRIVEESELKHIIIIGKGVSKILASRIQQLKIPFTTVSQPQARGSAEWQLENYRKYQRICSEFS